jgi:hypothetical protein
MMSSTSATTSAPAPHAQSDALSTSIGDAAGQSDEQRVQYLFRHSLRSGRVHVLQHLIQRHRAQAVRP